MMRIQQPAGELQQSSSPGCADVPARLIAVFVRDVDADSQALAWAAAEATPHHDTVHVVHAFKPLAVSECSWDPVRRARDRRRNAARLVISRACQRTRYSHPGLAVDGSAVPGDAADILEEFSDVLDLIVIGQGKDDEDSRAEAGHTATDFVRRSRCPIVVVPGDYDPTGDARAPVTALLDSMSVPTGIIEFGLSEAARRGTTLCVAQYWSGLHADEPASAEIIASHQEILDLQLSDIRESHPEVAMMSELLLQDSPAALAGVRAASQLIIVPSCSRHLPTLLDAPMPARCPTLVLPAKQFCG